MGAAGTEAGVRGPLRPFLRRTISTRHEVPALAAGKGATRLHVRASAIVRKGQHPRVVSRVSVSGSAEAFVRTSSRLRQGEALVGSRRLSLRAQRGTCFPVIRKDSRFLASLVMTIF